MEVLLGLDIGTTACKAVALTLDGTEVSAAVAATPWRRVPTGAEMAPADLEAVAVDVLRRTVPAAARVLAIGVTGMGEAGVLQRSDGSPAAPIVAWHDRRGDEVAAGLPDVNGVTFSAATGLPRSGRCSAAKTRSLASNEPAAATEVVRWLGVPEYVVSVLGGDRSCELSLAARTGWLDLHRRSWLPEAVQWTGLPRLELPPPVPAGASLGRVTAGPSEFVGAVLTVGGHDHVCATVGADSLGMGDVLNSLGTGEAMVRALQPPLPPEKVEAAVEAGLTVGWHVLPTAQVLMAGLGSGLALRRVLDLLGIGPQERTALDAAALAAPAGARGLSVDGVADESCDLRNIPYDVSPGLVWRAALEAVMRRGREALDVMAEVAGPCSRVVATGGWLRSEAIRRIKEAAIGPFELSPTDEAAARGAALLAGCAAGTYPSPYDVPSPTAHEE